MPFFSRLWQKIFIYSLVLIVASGAMGIVLVHEKLMDKASSVVVAFTAEIGRALKGQSPQEADAFLAKFNNQEARLWLEREDGILLAGDRFAGRPGKEWQEHLHSPRRFHDVTLWRTDIKSPMFLAVTPCDLAGNKAVLYGAYMAFPVPPLETLLSPGVATIALITGLLTLWMATKVGRPLRRLQQEVCEITGTVRLRNVTVSGSDEIADVARAVNRLVEGLRLHITSMNQLVMNISHELRSPLTRMALSADMIAPAFALLRQKGGETAGDEDVILLAERNFEALRQELDHMDKLIGSTLLSSKLDVRDPENLAAVVSLSTLCANATERYEGVFRQAGTRFMHSFDEDVSVRGDETLLLQVLSNLLDNAVKYASGPEPKVSLRLFRENGRAVLTVGNTHAPLPDDLFERFFDPYYRHEQQTGTGVGLGLAIVRKIATLHGGTVHAENSRTGIVFILSLPEYTG